MISLPPEQHKEFTGQVVIALRRDKGQFTDDQKQKLYGILQKRGVSAYISYGDEILNEALAKYNEELAAKNIDTVPEWIAPAHQELDLTTLDPDALGLDAFSSEEDAKLIDAIELAKHKQSLGADPLPTAPAVPVEASKPSAILKTSALAAIDLGLYIFALGKAVKEPDSVESPRGFHSSTNDREKVNDIWTRKPEANIGIDCGSSGVCVFDFDVKEEIPDWVDSFRTLKIKTGKGLHVYTRGARPSKDMYNPSGTHIGEIKSIGGYVIWNKSVHPSGAIYQIVDSSPIAPTPDDRIAELTKSAPASKEVARDKDGLVPVGSIHPFMLREAGRLRGLGLSAEAIEPALRELVHKNCQVPPGGFDDSKIVTMSKSIENFPEGRPTELLFTQQPTDANSTWPPLIPLDNALSPVPAFNTEWIPEAIRPWTVDVAERMSVPVDFTAVAALCALAGVTGRRVFVFPKANDKEWRESICIPGAVVAASGKKKTPTWKPFMNPISELEAEWGEERAAQVAKYKEEQKAWKANKKKSETDGVVDNTPEPKEPAPSRRLLINDATYEIIQDILKDNPQGILYFRDELSGWAAELDREGREGQRQFFLSMMNGDDRMAVDRITREGGSAVLCGTVFGSFQPELLRSFLFDSKTIEEGTVPRFHMLVWPDDSTKPRTDRPANTMAKDTYRRIVRQLAVVKPESLFFHFDAEAQQLFYQFQDRNTAKIESEPNLGKQSHLSKYEGAIAKIAALFQLVDLVAAARLVPVQTVSFDKPVETKSVPEDITGHHTIDAKHFQMAEAFLGYLEAHMHRVYDSQRNDVQQAMDLIAGKLRKGELRNGFTVRYLQRKHWVNQAAVAEFALDELEENGWVRKMPRPTGPGQHATRYEANPDIRALG